MAKKSTNPIITVQVDDEIIERPMTDEEVAEQAAHVPIEAPVEEVI